MPQSKSIKKPHCPERGAGMWLFGIELGVGGDELLSFECPRCEHIEAMTRKSNTPHFS